MNKIELPNFLADEGVYNWAVVVAGRVVPERPTQAAVKRLDAAVRRRAEESGLPLGFVHMGTTVNWEASKDEKPGYESAPAVIGLVLAFGGCDDPRRVTRAQLDPAAFSTIPAAFWKMLADEHQIESGEDGLWFVPGGWTAASIYDGTAVYEDGAWVGGKPKAILSCSTDAPEAVRLTDHELPETMWLAARAA